MQSKGSPVLSQVNRWQAEKHVYMLLLELDRQVSGEGRRLFDYHYEE